MLQFQTTVHLFYTNKFLIYQLSIKIIYQQEKTVECENSVLCPCFSSVLVKRNLNVAVVQSDNYLTITVHSNMKKAKRPAKQIQIRIR